MAILLSIRVKSLVWPIRLLIDMLKTCKVVPTGEILANRIQVNMMQ